MDCAKRDELSTLVSIGTHTVWSSVRPIKSILFVYIINQPPTSTHSTTYFTQGARTLLWWIAFFCTSAPCEKQTRRRSTGASHATDGGLPGEDEEARSCSSSRILKDVGSAVVVPWRLDPSQPLGLHVRLGGRTRLAAPGTGR